MESGPDLRRNAAVPAPKSLSTAPKTLSMRGAPMIAHLGDQDDPQKAAETSVKLRENTAANPFKLASTFGGTGSGANQGVIAGAEYVRGPLQPAWAAQLAEKRALR
ncbi:unnamed protein product [Effrenium voratum]|uniref:Uncharacterized protein n=1 Tax=Effrenium voratum TaxID=2562239 RepID=A0AA36INF7_9DINO|nr:unnamed protein product [Effrenium voratum]